ncbi:hypothetical protein EYF80_028505 [Liparis tanakae]|uniref:Uncharacterized protein n=1 Tax=Liparis tanakae TaxID=230148 RepID=A0A4Z2H955_9TELE|nr:hypothetical protein EYF80_028505 [Liparis tanakae]
MKPGNETQDSGAGSYKEDGTKPESRGRRPRGNQGEKEGGKEEGKWLGEGWKPAQDFTRYTSPLNIEVARAELMHLSSFNVIPTLLNRLSSLLSIPHTDSQPVVPNGADSCSLYSILAQHRSGKPSSHRLSQACNRLHSQPLSAAHLSRRGSAGFPDN